MRVYTRTGDYGDTGLYDGTRLTKGDEIFDVLGNLDTVASANGNLLLHLQREIDSCSIKDRILQWWNGPSEKQKHLRQAIVFIRNVQKTLLAIGSIIATPNPRPGSKLPEITPQDTLLVEAQIDSFTQLKELTTFLCIEARNDAEGWCHMCRVLTRTAERSIVGLGSVSPDIMTYVNRLSDYYFTLGRFLGEPSQ